MRYVLTVLKNMLVSDKVGSLARSYGFDVVARTGEDAIARAKMIRPVLIVVDIEESPTLVNELKSAGITSPVIAIYSDTKNAAKAVASGYYGLHAVPKAALEHGLTDFLNRFKNI